jgi:predicted outer membrane repeat protein
MNRKVLLVVGMALSIWGLHAEKATAFSVLANYTLNGTLADNQAPSDPTRNMQHFGGTPVYDRQGIVLTGTKYLQSPLISSFVNSEFTITANFRISSYPADYMPVVTAFDSEIAAFITSSGVLQLRVGSGTISSSLIIPVGEFHNVTITRDVTTTRLYFNGIIAATSTNSVTSTTNRVLTRSEIGSVTRYFSGIIKNIQVYNLSNNVNTLTDAATPSVGQLRWAVNNLSGGAVVFSPTLSGTINLTGPLYLGRFSGAMFGAITICEPPSGNISLALSSANPILEITEAENLFQPFPDDAAIAATRHTLPTKNTEEGKTTVIGISNDIVNIVGIGFNGLTVSSGIRFPQATTSFLAFLGTFRAIRCTFVNLRSSGGGSAALMTGGSAGYNFENCRFENNNATGTSSGGALRITAGWLECQNCTFQSNSAGGTGGAVSIAARADFEGCTFQSNSASGNGGAIEVSNTGATADIVNCTFSANTASGTLGGGAVLDGGTASTVRLTNCTLSGNSATATGASGGGIRVGAGELETLRNTIVANNTASSNPDISGAVNDKGSTNNLIRNGTGVTGITDGVNGNQIGTAAVPREPLLAALGSYGGVTQTFALLPGSPAINAGSLSSPGTDQRGVSRVGAPDIGAFESRGFNIAVTGGSGQTTLVNTPFSASLQASVTSSFGEPVNGGRITFNAPPSGASCTFGTNPAIITSGAVSTTATANATFGSYTVSASASGIATPASYSMVNMATEPTAQPTSLLLNTAPVNPPTITGSFTPASGPPNGYLVVRRTSTTSRTPPADGSTYMVGSIFFGQFVVSNTAATAFTDNSGLTEGTSYIYDVYAFNGAGAATNYRQSSPLTGTLTALPVELTAFTATQEGNRVILHWSTASEVNNAGFEVQRRAVEKNDAQKEWQILGFVRGKGTTNEAQSYMFLDRTATGKVQYRLKQLDFDGTAEYSPTIEVDAGMPRAFELWQNYPNPFNPMTIISYQLPVASQVSLKVFDVLGREVATLVERQQEAGRYQVPFNAANMTSGVYFYTLRAGNFLQTRKMLLVK